MVFMLHVQKGEILTINVHINPSYGIVTGLIHDLLDIFLLI